jgi:hypothetical protein
MVRHLVASLAALSLAVSVVPISAASVDADLLLQGGTMIEKARADGLRITADQYPYTANSFSLMDAALPEPQIEWCKRAELAKRMAAEPEFAASISPTSNATRSSATEL